MGKYVQTPWPATPPTEKRIRLSNILVGNANHVQARQEEGKWGVFPGPATFGVPAVTQKY